MKRNGVLFFCAALVILGAAPARAEGTLSLEALIEEGLKNNPELNAQKKRHEAATARIWQAASLSDPTVSFEYDKMTADRDLSGEPMQIFSLSQEIPFPTKLFLRAKIASSGAKIAYQNYKATERKLLAALASQYEEVLFIERSLEIAGENKAIVSQFSQVTGTRYGANKTGQADVLKAQVELARIENEIVLLNQRRVTAAARLNVLLGRDPKTEIASLAVPQPVRLNLGLDDLYALARRHNPELKAYAIALDKGKAAKSLAKSEFLPDLELRYSRMGRGGSSPDDMWAGMVGVTIPLWGYKQAFGVKEMNRELEMLEFEYKDKENMVLFDINDAFARFNSRARLIEMYETAFIPQASQTVEAALRGYGSEQTDFLMLLDSQRMLTEFKLQHYEAILELKTALADLQRAVGTDLDVE